MAPEPGSRNNWLALVRWAILSALAVWLIAGLRFHARLSPLVPDDHSELQRLTAFFEKHQTSNLLALECHGDEPAAMAMHLKHCADQLRTLGARPMQPSDGPSTARLLQQTYAHLPRLLDEEQLQSLTPRLEQDAIGDRIDVIAARLRRSDGALHAGVLLRDPLGLAALLVDDIDRNRTGIDSMDGVAIHDDGQHAVLVLQIPFAPSDTQRTDRLMAAIDGLQKKADQQGLHLEAIGSYRHFHDNSRAIQSTLLTTIPITILLIATLLLSLFRSFRSIFVLHLPALAAAGGGLALLALGSDGAIPLMLLGFASGIIGIAVDYGIHMCHARNRGHSAHVRRPIIVSALTSCAAFCVLLTSPIPIVSSLALAMLGGIIAAACCTLDVLPRLLPAGSRPPVWQATERSIGSWALRRDWRILIAIGLISAVLLPGLAHMRFVDDLHSLDGSSPATKQSLSAFQQRWGVLGDSNFLVATSDDLDRSLAALEAVKHAVDLRPSPLDIVLPSRARQRSNLAAWNTFWSAYGPRFENRLRSQCQARGLNPAAFDQTLDLYRPHTDTEVPFIDHDTWKDTSLAGLLAQLTRHADGQWTVTNPIIERTGQSQGLLERIDQACQTAPGKDTPWLASRRWLARDLIGSLQTELLTRSGIMFFVMLTILAICLRRPRRVLAVALPPLLALAWSFGAFGWLGVPLLPFHLFIAAFITGIGVDDGLFLSHDRRRMQAIVPILATTLTTVIGLGAMILSDHPVLSNIGLSLIVGMAACLTACLLCCALIAGPSEDERLDPLRPEEETAA